jgi:hypothetical protein
MRDALLLALTITLEPLPIIGFIVVLSTDRGPRNGAAFIAGWLACFLVVIGATLALTGGKPVQTNSAPDTIGLIVTALIGAGLLVLAWRRYRHPSTAPPAEPAWMKKLDRMGPATAAGLGVLLQPWPLIAAGAVDVSHADLSSTASVLSLIGFCLIGTASLLIMESYSLAKPASSREALARLRAWIEGHRDRLLTGIAFAIGTYLLIKGIVGLI